MNNSYENILIDLKNALEAKKGEEIAVLDLSKIHSYLHFFIIVTAGSRIHSRSLANEAAQIMGEAGYNPRMTPHGGSGWTIVDGFEIVVHVFLEEEREYYNLEHLWADAARPLSHS
ncbi:MAG: ribosome silencing factor [Spirochaetes bacterium]|jgi:ribosome-associated protein|nr:ribosome silencing factor [Spirochaetota bacterium]